MNDVQTIDLTYDWGDFKTYVVVEDVIRFPSLYPNKLKDLDELDYANILVNKEFVFQPHCILTFLEWWYEFGERIFTKPLWWVTGLETDLVIEVDTNLIRLRSFVIRDTRIWLSKCQSNGEQFARSISAIPDGPRLIQETYVTQDLWFRRAMEIIKCYRELLGMFVNHLESPKNYHGDDPELAARVWEFVRKEIIGSHVESAQDDAPM